MSRNPLSDALSPDLSTVFEALSDPTCREILRALDRAKTAAEVAAAVEIPRSTAYEKLRLLAETGLVRRHEGDEEVRYAVDFEDVVVRPSDDGLDLTVSRPSRSATEQLTGMWREVRSEAGGN